MPPHTFRLAHRQILSAVLCSLSLMGLSPAGASPATDLFRAATERAMRNYYGWSTGDLPALSDKYGAILAERCAPAGDSCDYATARTVLGDLFKEFGDAHTAVRDPEAALRLREVMQDRAVARTGARVVRVEGGLLVVSIMPGSPAETDGLRLNDLLTSVNGQAAGKHGTVNAPIGPTEFVRLERGGQPLDVSVRRAGQPERSFRLGSQLLKARDVPTLSWAGADGKVAVISYPTFLPRDAAELFLSRLQDAQAQGARELIVDLRFNSGGSLAECVAAASVFAPVQYREKFRGGSQMYRGVGGMEPRGSDRLRLPPPGSAGVWQGPAAVLVGPNTASCAEVFTFYAQQAGVLAVGEVTRGVCNSGVIFDDLPDGGVLAVTILRAFTADDQPLPERITPDIIAPLDIDLLTIQGKDTTLDAAIRALDARPAAAPSLGGWPTDSH